MHDVGSLYFRLIWSRVRSQVQYRTSFVLYVLGAFVLTLSDFLVIWVIFRCVRGLVRAINGQPIENPTGWW